MLPLGKPSELPFPFPNGLCRGKAAVPRPSVATRPALATLAGPSGASSASSWSLAPPQLRSQGLSYAGGRGTAVRNRGERYTRDKVCDS